MRIGMILDSSFPPDVRVENEALSLIKQGHEVFLFSLDFARLAPTENYKHIHVRRYQASALVYKLSALAYTLPFFRWLVTPLIKHFIRQNRIEVLHIHDMVIADAVLAANKLFQLPVVLDLHENRPEIMKEYKHVTSVSGRLLIHLDTWRGKYYELVRRSNFTIVVTDAAKRDIISKVSDSGNKIFVVPNSVKPSEFLSYPIQTTIEEKMRGTYNIVYIGDTSIRRGTDTAIRAIDRLRNEMPLIRLWLVGKSSADHELKKLADDLDLNAFIMFEGWQQPSLLVSYMHNASIGLSPLKRNRHHDTTFANKIFQYMVSGKPVLVSDCPAQAEVISDEQCGLIFKADEADDLAEKILELYRNEGLAKQMGERGRRAVFDRWNWDKTDRELVALYSNRLSQSSQP